MQKQVLLFDLDGTLTDSAPGIIHSAIYALKEFGIHADPTDLKKFIGPPLSQSFEEFYGFSKKQAAEAVTKFSASFGRLESIYLSPLLNQKSLPKEFLSTSPSPGILRESLAVNWMEPARIKQR